MKTSVYQHALYRLRAAKTVAEVDYLSRAYVGLYQQSHLSSVELVRLHGIASGVKSNIRACNVDPALYRLARIYRFKDRIYKRRLPSGRFVTVVDERRIARG